MPETDSLKPILFKLSAETLADLDHVTQVFGLRTRHDALRFAARDVARRNPLPERQKSTKKRTKKI